jgi:multisubunit Na+/H+ antiporter MnhB subunit
VVGLANVVLIVATLPRPPKLTGMVTFVVCGGSVLLAYREDPASFHREVSRTEALRVILALVVGVGIITVLGMTYGKL